MHTTHSFFWLQLLILPSERLVAILTLSYRILRTHNIGIVLFLKPVCLCLQNNNERNRQYDHEKCDQPIDSHHTLSILRSIAQVLPVDVVRSASIRDLGELLEDELLLDLFSLLLAAACAAP